ncbi:MAG TPA: glycosyltransferase family 2 protein [Pirellulales bacterium]|nr:glycosyltransferase family 2 protein [Pirellulales bacterium]
MSQSVTLEDSSGSAGHEFAGPGFAASEFSGPHSRELVARLADEVAHLDHAVRVDLLERLLGKSVCRRLGIFPLPPGFVLSVVIPVYNEFRTIEEVVRRVRASGVPTEIIIVDDGSTDGTRELLRGWPSAPDLKVFMHETNLGKGSALRTGFGHATGEVVIVQDADLEYDPAEFEKLIQPIVDDLADVVFGSRFTGDNQRVLYFWHSVGNKLLTLLSNAMTNLNLTDMETCYKAFRRDVIQGIAPTLREQRFGIEPELTAKVARMPGVRIHERPISYCGRTYAEGKKITWRDGFRALWCIVRYSLGK